MVKPTQILAVFFVTFFSCTPMSVFAANTENATFAGGSFIYMQPMFDAVEGVIQTRVGYMGGNVANPRMVDVLEGYTGHHMVVQVTFDPARVYYTQLLEQYLHFIDPADMTGQFCHKGPMYAPVIFYEGDAQRQAAFAARAAIAIDRKAPQILDMPVRDIGQLFLAEEEYQAYYKKNPLRFAFKRQECGLREQTQK